MDRDELIKTGIDAAYFNYGKDDVDGDRIARVIAAVEPIIRADEREQAFPLYRRLLLDDLRSQVQALGDDAQAVANLAEGDAETYVAIGGMAMADDVLDLLDGNSDE